MNRRPRKGPGRRYPFPRLGPISFFIGCSPDLIDQQSARDHHSSRRSLQEPASPGASRTEAVEAAREVERPEVK
jgi:hypothetical protein